MKKIQYVWVACSLVLGTLLYGEDSNDLAFQAVRSDNVAGLRSLLLDGKSPNTRNERGSTLLMAAALAGSESCLQLLLEREADPNATNQDEFSALMWAVHDIRIVQQLLNHGADPNQRSPRNYSPLSLAARIEGNLEVVQLLFERGAEWRANVLYAAIQSEDIEMVRWLLNSRSDVSFNFDNALTSAAVSGSVPMVKFLLSKRIELTDERKLEPYALQKAAEYGHVEIVRLLLEQGAPVNEFTLKTHASSYPALMWAVADGGSERREVVELLLQHGADPNGSYTRRWDRFMEIPQTPLRWANLHADPKVMGLLSDAGAVPDEIVELKEWLSRPSDQGKTVTTDSIGASIERAIPLLEQTAMESFADFKNRANQGRGCISCHQQHIPMIALGVTKAAGFRRNEATSSSLLNLIIDDASSFTLRGPKPSPTLLGYMFWSLAGEKVPASHLTDVEAHRVTTLQRPDGSWQSKIRPPMQSSDITATALSLRALQIFPIPGRQREFERRIQRATNWLRDVQPEINEDWAYQLLGLAWAGEGAEALSVTVDGLLSKQRPNGGWAQLDGLESDAYATGLTLYALSVSGRLAPNDAAIRRGLEFLLNTQTSFGSWHVRRRAFPRQPTFQSGFPHGRDAWISATATSWAVMAMSQSLRRMVAEGSEPYIANENLVAAVRAPARLPSASTGIVEFERDVRPLLEESCLDCHGGAAQIRGKYSMITRETLLKGGRSKLAAVVPGDSASSQLIILAADQEEDQEMPPPHKRDFYPAWTDDQLSLVRAWIDQGAHWPAGVELDE